MNVIFFYKYLKFSKTYSIILFAIIVLIIVSCRSTKNVPEGYYLLNKYKLECDDKKIDNEELDAYIKQKPNRRILEVFRFHLGVYNIFFKTDAKKVRSKIAEIVGEEPVIYDDYLKKKSTLQLRSYLKNKGYYNANVFDTTIYRNKKANVYYTVKANIPYKILKVDYNIEDYVIESIVVRDSANSLLKIGKLFDSDVLQMERERISYLLKNKGYYNFMKEYIYYEVDSSLGINKVNITLGIKNIEGRLKHNKYNIRNIYVYPEYDHKIYQNDSTAVFDTIVLNNINFIFKGKLKTNLKILLSSIYIEKDDYYAKYNVDQTYKHLSELKLFKLINIKFTEIKSQNNKYLLDCYIQLSQFSKQSYITELEGTNSSGNIGAAANIQYQHKSLLQGAEIYHFKIGGGLQQQTSQSSAAIQSDEFIDEILPFNTIEYGGEMGIDIPKFWFINGNKSSAFVKKYQPKTNISLAYNYQNRPNYTRRIANLSYGYFWKSTKFLKHIVNPFEINLVDIPKIDSAFYADIENPFIKNSYRDYLISTSNYSLIYNNQDLKKRRRHMYLRANIEPAGNLLSTINKLTGVTNPSSTYLVANRKYAQYMKGDVDIRLYRMLYKENVLAYRFFAGLAYPYGNSSSIPFIKQYFAGGANSIRAWNVHELGPGSYYDTTSIFHYQNGDVKLEANIEYRFKLFWMIEAALFVDAGNIWSVVANDTRDGSIFKMNSFYDQIAVGSGFGTRFDFSFFVFRFDFGVKVRDPRMDAGSRFVLFEPPLVTTYNDVNINGNSTTATRFTIKESKFTVNIGIGYPF